MPTSYSEEEEIEKVYDKTDNLIKHTLKGHAHLIIIGNQFAITDVHKDLSLIHI